LGARGFAMELQLLDHLGAFGDSYDPQGTSL
jgi:hypothetical protein